MQKRKRLWQLGLFIICLAPFTYLVRRIVANDLGPDPGQFVVVWLGWSALSMLFVTLSSAQVSRWRPLSPLKKHRRLLGLTTFFYACCHMLAMWAFILGRDIQALVVEIVERPYITAGLAVVILLTPLALTSNQYSMRKLGRRWKTLHLLVYPAGALALVHYAWQLRGDWLLLGIFILWFALLLLFKFVNKRNGR
ncbi:MAG: protein-methionine-sulfoxide reductase heme-binding subunit MsrQ [Pseudomonadales bacterium]